MKTALFTNFSDETFTGYWNGTGKKIKAGQSIYMPDYLAQHFARHLVNRELLRLKADGSPVYKDGEKFTSPKKPLEVPIYMDLFNKAYTPDEDEEMLADGDPIDAAIAVANKNRDTKIVGPGTEAQIIVPPADDEDEDDDEFGGAPVEAASAPAPENSEGTTGVGLTA